MLPDLRAKTATRDYLSGKKALYSEVNYSSAGMNSANRCAECQFYLKPGFEKSDCAKVVGVINADGICDLFKQRVEEPAPVTEAPATHITIQVNHAN